MKSKLGEHKKIKNKLITPLNTIPNLHPLNWVNQRLPDLLWAAILASFFNRDVYLNLFRKIVNNLKKLKKYNNEIDILIISNIKNIDDYDFKFIFQDIEQNAEMQKYLSALLVLECLPSKEKWNLIIHNKVDEKTCYSIIAHAIKDCYDQKSQFATDIIWLSILFNSNKMYFPKNFDLNFITNYPNSDDKELNNSKIRALGNTYISNDLTFCDNFWNECFLKTGCIESESEYKVKNKILNKKELEKEIIDIINLIDIHFFKNIKNKQDDKMNIIFGIILYACDTLLKIIVLDIFYFKECKVLFRTIIECYINLSYLLKINTEDIFLKFKDYGLGKCKLESLKIEERNMFNNSFNVKSANLYINEDKSQEFQDMPISSNWSGKNIRDMAIDSGIKDIYDKYYDVLSDYVHCSFNAIRDISFSNCLNPLHRFHLIPKRHLSFISVEIINDIFDVMNLMFQILDNVYPEFKGRLNKKVIIENKEEHKNI